MICRGSVRPRTVAAVVALAALLSAAASADEASDRAEMAFWRSIEDSKNPAEYRAYLEAFPNGRFAPLARVRATSLEELISGQPAAGSAAAEVSSQSLAGRWKGRLVSEGGSPICGGVDFNGPMTIRDGWMSGWLLHSYAGQMMMNGKVTDRGELVGAVASSGVEEVIKLKGTFSGNTASGTWESGYHACMGKWSANKLD